jgi:hypothetical protein
MICVHFINIQGLQNNAENINYFNKKRNTDITICLETWLSPTSTIPFRNTISNHLTVNTQDIAGGRRHSGGILTFAKDSYTRQLVRVVYEDPQSRFVAMQIGDVTLICCYLAPSRNNDELEVILNKASELTNNFGSRCIICGDLNARLGAQSGDHASNARGNLLLEMLENRDLELQLPAQGKWTCFSSGGCSIPDLVLSNFQVSTLTVHENSIFSDHRPTTFEFEPDYGDSIGKDFRRWNVRKLIEEEVQKKYQHLLRNSLDIPLEALEQGNNNPSQANIDLAWQGIKRWIEEAASKSVGMMVISDRIPEDYWTDDLVDMRESIQQSMMELQQAITDPTSPLTPQDCRNRAAAITRTQRDFRIAGKARRQALFERAVDDLGREP